MTQGISKRFGALARFWCETLSEAEKSHVSRFVRAGARVVIIVVSSASNLCPYTRSNEKKKLLVRERDHAGQIGEQRGKAIGPELADDLLLDLLPERERSQQALTTTGRKGHQFLSTTMMFGTPVDVTLSELALEFFFPADATTAETVHRAARGRDQARSQLA